MSKETLKLFRLIIPGVMILIFGLPLFTFPTFSQMNLGVFAPFKNLPSYVPESIYKIIAVVVLGTLYYTFDIRWYFLRESLDLIHINIHSKLLSPFANDRNLIPHMQKLREGNTLVNAFYKLIDNDESLKEKAKDVYFNGLLWSSFADLQGISLIATCLYLLVYGITREQSLFIYTVICMALTIFSRFILLPRITAKHIKYSDDQLEFILQHYLPELKSKLYSLSGLE